MKSAILNSTYLSNTLGLETTNWIFRVSIFQSTCLLILKVVAKLFVQIGKGELLDFPMIAMGKPDLCCEPVRSKSSYLKQRSN